MFLNLGGKPFNIPGFENYDIDDFDLTEFWPIESDSAEGMIFIHVFGEIPWRKICFIMGEAKRVLKDDGVVRIAVPDIEFGDNLMQWQLGWSNINLFTEDVFLKALPKLGFPIVKVCEPGQTFSKYPPIILGDNRKDESIFIEAFKSKKGLA